MKEEVDTPNAYKRTRVSEELLLIEGISHALRFGCGIMCRKKHLKTFSAKKHDRKQTNCFLLTERGIL